MKHLKVYTYVVSILLVVLVVSGCAAPKTTPATAAAQPSSTAAIPKASPTTYPLITITFAAGDKCSMDGATSLMSGIFRVNVVVESWEHDKYGLGIGNLAIDKTTDELQDSLNKHFVPDWLNIIDFQEFTQAVGDSYTFTFYTSSSKGPLIFSCFWSDPIVGSTTERNEVNFETLGPVEVVNAP